MKVFVICAVMLAFSFNSHAQTADAILGKWFSHTKEAQISIYKKADKYFGKLSWLKTVNDAAGKPKIDINNPQASLRSQPLLGAEILKDFIYNGDNAYINGTIYDPKNGKTYSCKLTLNGTQLKIRGYIGISLFGRTEVWTKAE